MDEPSGRWERVVQVDSPVSRQQFRRCARELLAVALAFVAALTVSGFVVTVPAWADDAAAVQPSQPTSGPGGTGLDAAPYSDATGIDVEPFQPVKGYWIYKPTTLRQGASAPASLPVLVFLHGAFGANPTRSSDGWLKKLAQAGAYVVFPKFEAVVFPSNTPPAEREDNAIGAISRALAKLKSGTDTRFPNANTAAIDYIGYSEGALMAMTIASKHATTKLPPARSMTLFHAWPGAAEADAGELNQQIAYDTIKNGAFTSLSLTTPITCVVGNSDDAPGRSGCDRIWDALGTHQRTRQYVVAFSDTYGTPDISSWHGAPGLSSTPGLTTDAYDYFVTWKLSDAIPVCARTGSKFCSYATGGTNQQVCNGQWTKNGAPALPVNRLLVFPYQSIPTYGVPGLNSDPSAPQTKFALPADARSRCS